MSSMLFRSAACFAVMFFVSAACAKKPPADNEQVRRVEATADKLAKTYDAETGLFRGTGWWNSANGISALARVSGVLHTREFDSIFANTFLAAQKKHPGFLNEFYDDEGWWALAWLDVYELRGGARYRAMAETIFADMSSGWSDSCGGGIWWKKNEHYKNAIANELFLSVAVRLAENTRGSDRAKYMDWAKRETSWFVQSGMINAQGLINDGLDDACRNNEKTEWTYNQGVILTGLAGVARLNGDRAARVLGERIAHAVALHLVDADGILHDPCEPNCGEDGGQFKGILVRNLVTIERASRSADIGLLLKRNAESVWTKAKTDDGWFAVNWAGPPGDGGTGSLISALDALTVPLLASDR